MLIHENSELGHALSEPFAPEDVEWLAVTKRDYGWSTYSKRFWIKPVPYINKTAVMRRLDAVCGADGWRTDIRPIITSSPEVQGFICSISIRVDENTWVSKSDVAPLTEFEKIKGGATDAFKRAAQHWGIGRYLNTVMQSSEVSQFCDAYAQKPSDTTDYAWVLVPANIQPGVEGSKKIRIYYKPPQFPAWALPTKKTDQVTNQTPKTETRDKDTTKTDAKPTVPVQDSPPKEKATSKAKVEKKTTAIPPKTTAVSPKTTVVPPKATESPPKTTGLPPETTELPPKTVSADKPKTQKTATAPQTVESSDLIAAEIASCFEMLEISADQISNSKVMESMNLLARSWSCGVVVNIHGIVDVDSAKSFSHYIEQIATCKKLWGVKFIRDLNPAVQLWSPDGKAQNVSDLSRGNIDSFTEFIQKETESA